MIQQSVTKSGVVLNDLHVRLDGLLFGRIACADGGAIDMVGRATCLDRSSRPGCQVARPAVTFLAREPLVLMMRGMALAEAIDDAELVARSIGGNREAFGGIVARYQSLVCSIAYSATGSIARSEDLAQETFLVAWKQMAHLREPAKLRSWLAAIARNLLNGNARSEERAPKSTSLELVADAEDAPATQPLAPDQLISHEEETLVWRALEQIPPLYREPLVLFYREQGSVEQVARALGLSEEVVRQRLSRGRKLLRASVVSFVEGTLSRSSPRKGFTLAVVAALPATTGSATVLSLGGAAAKGGLAKTAAASLSLVAGPMTSAVSVYFSVRAGLDATRTARERSAVLRHTARLVAVSVFYGLGIGALALSRRFWASHNHALVAISIGFPLAFAAWLSFAVARGTRRMRRVRAEERELHPEAFRGTAAFEYRSEATLFGIPLVHIRQGPPEENAAPAIGIVAVGDRAIGFIAIGEMALGFISLGAVSAGVISVGGANIGLFALGGFSLGAFVFGGASLGYIASGGLAVGSHAAIGGVALARDFALGGLALAVHENDAAALDFFTRLHAGPAILLPCAAAMLLSICSSIWLARRARRSRMQMNPE